MFILYGPDALTEVEMIADYRINLRKYANSQQRNCYAVIFVILCIND